MMGRHYAGQLACVTYGSDTIEIFDHQGAHIAEADWPAPDVICVRASQLPPRPNRHRCPDTKRHPCPDAQLSPTS